jgi:cation diffusion facilitator CzcD-associated flavoprotein CzcO
MIKTVVVVGAGLSGLCAIKEMAEAGHNVICRETSEVIGGPSTSPVSTNVCGFFSRGHLSLSTLDLSSLPTLPPRSPFALV